MLAVIPVYTNPETGKQYHFGDSPKLLKVLKRCRIMAAVSFCMAIRINLE